jgi:SAM-dependent methyltransferase
VSAADTGCGSLHPGGLGLTARAVEGCAFAPGARILDVGCGRGTTVHYLRSLGLEAIGLELAAKLPEATSAGPPIPLLGGDGVHLPVASASLDGVFLECSLSLMPDLDGALAECARVLAPGGRLVVSDLYARSPATAPEPPGCGPRFVTMDRLFAALGKRSFRLDTWQDCSADLVAFVARRLLDAADETTLCDELARGRRVRAGYFLLLATRLPSREDHGHG